MNAQQIGLIALCLVSGLPFAAGFALAWWLRDRVTAYGPLGAVLPGWLRERI